MPSLSHWLERLRFLESGGPNRSPDIGPDRIGKVGCSSQPRPTNLISSRPGGLSEPTNRLGRLFPWLASLSRDKPVNPGPPLPCSSPVEAPVEGLSASVKTKERGCCRPNEGFRPRSFCRRNFRKQFFVGTLSRRISERKAYVLR